MPAEIRSKLLTVLVSLGALHLAGSLAGETLARDAEEYGDLLLEAAEAYMGAGCPNEAIPFLEKLVSSEAYGQVSQRRATA